MERNILREKSYRFAIDVIGVYKQLAEKEKDRIISRQLLRSGTSVGANVEEAVGGISRKDFLCKLTIAYKEAREANYWLRILRDTGDLEKSKADDLVEDSYELIRIMAKTQLTMKRNQESSPRCP